ncbi:MAG TPA: ABC transporter permease [Candidatus Aquicultor sp.]|jgi:lipopolysaccharide transport system permease protein
MDAIKHKVSPDDWTTIIEPRTGWFDINLAELWHYRDLILLFVRRDFVALYKQTVLGPTWFLLQPLFTTVVFTIVFGNIAHIPTDGLPQILFYMSGIITWNYFATCLTKTSDTFATNAPIFGKVYFPRLAVPISVVITNLFAFAIQFCLFLVFMLFFYLKGAPIKPNCWLLLAPVLLIQMAALGLGGGILVSSLTTKYRDLTFLVTFGVQLWMYATPVVYPLSQIPVKWQMLYALNPMTAVIETFRYAFLGAGSIKLWQLAVSLGMTALILVGGLVLFTRIEKSFMDTI